jgi:DNA-binding NtrC family response regulator
MEQGPEGFEGMIGHSQSLRDVFDRAARVAATNSTVLITGETGTGKELLATAIHRLSHRKAGPLVAVNVAAIPNTLVESELFGHVKGAFTDAVGERIGRFEAADDGTLFIDEIADLELPSQAKLLRVLETHVINRVGCNKDIPVDVRVIAATSRQLERMVAAGEFREDLYYRLNVVRIQLPALCQRRDDIPPLIQHFLNVFARKLNRPPLRLTPELLELLQSHEWPGNVRQLKNCLESMVVMSTAGVLGVENLPQAMVAPKHPQGLENLSLAGYPLVRLEMQAIRQTLHKYRGNRTQSAKSLGISVRTLQRKLKDGQTHIS